MVKRAATCGDEIRGRSVLVELPDGVIHQFCDLECVHRWIESIWEDIRKEIRELYAPE